MGSGKFIGDIRKLAATLVVSFALSSGALADNAKYIGCDDLADGGAVSSETSPPKERPAPRNPMEARSVETTTRTRVLQGMPLDQATSEGGGTSAKCWQRLDGMWREDTVIVLDKSTDTGVWDTPIPSMKNLSHGTYTSARTFFIFTDKDPNKTLRLMDAYHPEITAEFTSTDGVALDDVLTRGGPRKLYKATGKNDIAEQLRISVTFSGYVRLELDGKVYKRPSVGVLAEASSKDYKMDDAFIYQSNLDSFSASLRGYDITAQDPFRLLNNDKADVFQTQNYDLYRIQEKRSVPLGFDLKPEPEQGMVYQKTASSTETEIQKSVATTFGGKSRIGLADGAHLAVGAEHSHSRADSLRTRNFASQAVGYSRAKQYAILIDDAFVHLSDDFIDAVQYASRYDDEDPDADLFGKIIEKFGTHYANAVTYGANAQLTYSFTEEETDKINETMNSFAASVEAEMKFVNVSGNYGNETSDSKRNQDSKSAENIVFDAVGGNGSFDEKGYSAGGVVAPILLDLRPIHELLNPLFFPGHEEIYTKAREKLRLRIEDYMTVRAAGLSKFPIINTKLDGDFYADEFPGLIFHFRKKDFSNSSLMVDTIFGFNFRTYIQELNALKRLPNRPEMDRWVGSNYQNRFGDVGAKFKIPFEFVRTGEGYGLSKQLRNFLGAEWGPSLERGVIDPDEMERLTLLGQMDHTSNWQFQPDGSLVATLKKDAQPITFRPWTEENVKAVESAQISGAYKTIEAPGYTFTFAPAPRERREHYSPSHITGELAISVTYDDLATKGLPAWTQKFKIKPVEEEGVFKDAIFIGLFSQVDGEQVWWPEITEFEDLGKLDSILKNSGNWYSLTGRDYALSGTSFVLGTLSGRITFKALDETGEDLPFFAPFPQNAIWRKLDDGTVRLTLRDGTDRTILFTPVSEKAS